MDNRRVVITGLGAVSGFGLTTFEFWQSIKEGKTAIKPLSSPMEGVKVTIASTVPEFNPS